MPEEVKALTAYVEWRNETAKARQEAIAFRAELQGLSVVPVTFTGKAPDALKQEMKSIRDLGEGITKSIQGQAMSWSKSAEAAKEVTKEITRMNLAEVGIRKLVGGYGGLAFGASGVAGAGNIGKMFGGLAAGGGAGALGLAGLAAGIGILGAKIAFNQRSGETYAETLARQTKELVGLAQAEQAAAAESDRLNETLKTTKQVASEIAGELAARSQGGGALELFRIRQQREEAERKLEATRKAQAEAGATRRSNVDGGLAEGLAESLSRQLFGPFNPITQYYESYRQATVDAATQQESIYKARAAAEGDIVQILKQQEEQRRKDIEYQREQAHLAESSAEAMADTASWSAARGRMGSQRLRFGRAGAQPGEGNSAAMSLIGGDFAAGLRGILTVGNRNELKDSRKQLEDLKAERQEIIDRARPRGTSTLGAADEYGRSLLTDTLNAGREAADRDKERNKLLAKNLDNQRDTIRAIQKLNLGVQPG